MKLYDLIAMITEEANKRLTEAGLGADYSKEEHDEIARMVGHRNAEVRRPVELPADRLHLRSCAPSRSSKARPAPTCNMQRSACSRSCARRNGRPASGGARPAHTPEERGLILQLLSLHDAMATAETRRAPNVLCDYAFTLAQAFSRVYAEHHILSETDTALRGQPPRPRRPDAGNNDKVLDLLGIEVRQGCERIGTLAGLSLTPLSPLFMMHCNGPFRREAQGSGDTFDPSRRDQRSWRRRSNRPRKLSGKRTAKVMNFWKQAPPVGAFSPKG